MTEFSVSKDDLDTILPFAAEKRVLDIGTGSCTSAMALMSVASDVVTVESDRNMADAHREFLAGTGIRYYSGPWQDLEGEDFDLVLSDQFPLEDRLNSATYWYNRGSDVWVHDFARVLALPMISFYPEFQSGRIYGAPDDRGLNGLIRLHKEDSVGREV